MFEITNVIYSSKTLEGKCLNGFHVREVDETGEPVYDQCGRPVYRSAETEKTVVKHSESYVINDDGNIRIITRKQAKRIYGARQVRKAVRAYRV